MKNQEHDQNALRPCDACGRALPASELGEVATRTLCPQCAIEWQMRQRSDWPPPGYVWDGVEWRFDPDSIGQQPVAGYQPTEREVRWWCFLAWMIATGKLAVGAEEGADAPRGSRRRGKVSVPTQ